MIPFRVLWRPRALRQLENHDADSRSRAIAFLILYSLMALCSAALTRIDADARQSLNGHLPSQSFGLNPSIDSKMKDSHHMEELAWPNRAYTMLIRNITPFIPSSLISHYHNQIFYFALFTFLTSAFWVHSLEHNQPFRREIRYGTLSATTIAAVLHFSEIYDLRMWAFMTAPWGWLVGSVLSTILHWWMGNDWVDIGEDGGSL